MSSISKQEVNERIDRFLNKEDVSNDNVQHINSYIIENLYDDEANDLIEYLDLYMTSYDEETIAKKLKYLKKILEERNV